MIIEQISRSLFLPIEYLANLARSASHHYKTYTIPKRRGGERVIHQPSRQLKAVQRWITSNVTALLPLHSAASAYRTGRGIVDNARQHVNARFVTRIDLADFFPSLTKDDVAALLGATTANIPQLAGWSVADTEFFVKVVCKDGRLTIGAPSSPALSNALCCLLDTELHTFCAGRGIVYTRYADDLFFSTSTPSELRSLPQEVERMLGNVPYPKGLRINHDKTLYSSTRQRRVVTGITLTSDFQLSVGRDTKRAIRSLVFNCENLNKTERKKLAGWLAHCRNVEPDFINRLILKYGSEQVRSAMHPQRGEY